MTPRGHKRFSVLEKKKSKTGLRRFDVDELSQSARDMEREITIQKLLWIIEEALSTCLEGLETVKKAIR